MMSRVNWLAMFAVSVALPVGAVLAQPATPNASAPRAGGATTPKPVDPIGPLPETDPNAAPPQEPAPPPPPPLPPPQWRFDQASALLTYIQWVAREGLNPADYDPAGLESAMRSNDPMVLAQAATDRFNKLSSDLALGHVRGDARVDWHVADKDLDEVR